MNWRKIGKALKVVIDSDLIEESQDSEAKKFILDMLATRPCTEEHLVTQEQFHRLDDYVREFTSQLPNVLRILRQLHPDDFTDDPYRESYEFAIEMNIGSRGSIDVTRIKFDAVSEMFGKYLTLEKQVAIKGFDKGSDWVVFDAINAFQAEFIVGVVGCAREVIVALAEQPSDAWRLMAKLMYENFAKSEKSIPDAESVVSQTRKSFIDHTKRVAIDRMISGLQSVHPDKKELLNEGRKKASIAVDTMVALHSNGVSVQIPDNFTHETKIEISGDNNVVFMPNITKIELPSGAVVRDDDDEQTEGATLKDE